MKPTLTLRDLFWLVLVVASFFWGYVTHRRHQAQAISEGRLKIVLPHPSNPSAK